MNKTFTSTFISTINNNHQFTKTYYTNSLSRALYLTNLYLTINPNCKFINIQENT